MVDTTNESQYEKCKKMAHFIQPNIHPHIMTTYEKVIKERQPGIYIYKNYIRDLDPSASKAPLLEDIIAMSTYIALSKESIDQAIKTYHENRRVYKRNWLNSIKEEITSPDKMKPKKPQLLRKFAESKHMMDALDRSNLQEQTIEEIMLEKYEELENWRSDTTAPITDFYFLGKKPVKSISNGFVNDITFESLTIIKNLFGGSIEGFNVKYPTNMSEYPVFNYRSSWLDFEPALIENELIFLNQYEFEDDDKNVFGDIKVQYSPEQKLPATTSKKAISRIEKDYQVDYLKQKELDMKDHEIMTQLFNLINGENLNDQYISCDLRDFVRKIFHIKVPRKVHYDDVENRLKKLKSFDYTITVKSKETGEIVETTSLGLLNYININYKDNILQFTPSEQWKRTYVQKKYINILADSYTTIASTQTKGIMMILQQERLTEYSKGSSSKTFSLKFFRAHMKLQRIGNAALIKELTHHLSILKNEQIVVKDFDFINKNSALHIEFMDLEDKELFAYEYNTKNALESSDVIDTDFKEI